jgi:hypothetical protein
MIANAQQFGAQGESVPSLAYGWPGAGAGAPLPVAPVTVAKTSNSLSVVAWGPRRHLKPVPGGVAVLPSSVPRIIESHANRGALPPRPRSRGPVGTGANAS